MEKYGAELDNEKVKQANTDAGRNLCPLCGAESGEDRVCPIHGQEGFEKKPDAIPAGRVATTPNKANAPRKG